MKPKNKIKVSFVSPKAYPLFDPSADGVIGGAEVDLYMLATELAKDDLFDVSIITADYGQPPEQIIENVRVIKSLDFKQNPIAGAAKIWKAFKKANADIYMLKTPSPGVPLTAMFCRLHKRAFVYRLAHSREFDGTYAAAHPFMNMMFKRSLSSAKLIFAQNESDADNVRTAGFQAITIPNGHRLAKTNIAEKNTILWVGRSAEVKNPYCFLKLAQSFPEIPFTMICQRATGDNQYDKLTAKAKQIENLEFLESVPFKKVDDYFAKAKVLINTSDSEGFPNTFIQACKASTPILSLNVNPDGFLNKYNCGIMAKGDLMILKQQLRTILNNNTFMTMGNNANSYFASNHDVANIVKRYAGFFKEMLRGEGQ